MRLPARAIHYGLLLLLTGIALFFCAGSDLDALQFYANSLGLRVFNVCVPNSPSDNTEYTRYTVGVDQDGNTTQISSDDQADRSDCDYSVGEQDQVDPSAVQAAQGMTTTNSAPASSARRSKPEAAGPKAASSAPHFVNALPYARPVPFLPAFSAADAAMIPSSCDPNASFYAVNHANSLVTHFSACPLAVIDTIPVFANPLHPAMTPDGTLLLVTSNAGAVNFISTATDTVVYTLLTPPNVYPSGIAISPDGSTAYVTNYNNVDIGVLVINIPSRTITGTIPLPIEYPKQIFLTPDGAQAWVNFYGNSEIYIIDTFSGTVIAALQTQTLATTGMAFNATGTNAYVAVQPSDLVVYDTATLVQIADIQVGTSPVDVVLTPDGGSLYVTSFTSSTIAVVDAHTNQLLTNITAPGVDQRAFTIIPTVP